MFSCICLLVFFNITPFLSFIHQIRMCLLNKIEINTKFSISFEVVAAKLWKVCELGIRCAWREERAEHKKNLVQLIAKSL